MHHQVGNTLFGHAHLALALKGKGLGDNTDGQDAQVMGRFGHDRCSTGAGAAAHASGDEHHLGTFQCIGDLILAFLRCTLADLRVSTSAAALGQLCAKLNLLGSLGVDQCLLVGIHCYKFNAIQAASTMRFTALPPPPPTPITLMLVTFCISSSRTNAISVSP